jgi:hypothetical protein
MSYRRILCIFRDHESREIVEVHDTDLHVLFRAFLPARSGHR